MHGPWFKPRRRHGVSRVEYAASVTGLGVHDHVLVKVPDDERVVAGPRKRQRLLARDMILTGNAQLQVAVHLRQTRRWEYRESVGPHLVMDKLARR